FQSPFAPDAGRATSSQKSIDLDSPPDDEPCFYLVSGLESRGLACYLAVRTYRKASVPKLCQTLYQQTKRTSDASWIRPASRPCLPSPSPRPARHGRCSTRRSPLSPSASARREPPRSAWSIAMPARFAASLLAASARLTLPSR